MPQSQTTKGYLITVAGVLAITPDSLLARLTNVDPFTLIVGRGVLGSLVMLVVCLALFRGNFWATAKALGAWGLFAALAHASSNFSFLTALMTTSVANVLVIIATTPLLAAFFAWLFMRETVRLGTWLAIAGCFVGVIIVVSGSLGQGSLVGDLVGICAAMFLAIYLTIVRKLQGQNIMPATGLGMMLGALVAAPFAGFPEMSALQWLWLVLGGAVVIPLASALLAIGPRYIPSPEAAMLMTLETILGPLWVWLVLREEPGEQTILGGALIITVLMVHAIYRMRTSAARIEPE